MKFFTSTVQLIAVVVLIGGAVIALVSGSSTTRDQPVEAALAKGSGVLDNLTFTTTLGPQGKPGDIRDAMFFREGQFYSLECTDRCNYPPSAYFARAVEGGHEFVIEAWCPTKAATMVWRGRIEGEMVSGTVTWTVRRFYWTTGTVLEFSGKRATQAEVSLWRL